MVKERDTISAIAELIKLRKKDLDAESFKMGYWFATLSIVSQLVRRLASIKRYAEKEGTSPLISAWVDEFEIFVRSLYKLSLIHI